MLSNITTAISSYSFFFPQIASDELLRVSWLVWCCLLRCFPCFFFEHALNLWTRISSWFPILPKRAYHSHSTDTTHGLFWYVHMRSTYSVQSHPPFPFQPSADVFSSYATSSSWAQPSISTPISLQAVLEYWAVSLTGSWMLMKVAGGERAAVNTELWVLRHWRLLTRRVEAGKMTVSKT
jgi:hypothetical protein